MAPSKHKHKRTGRAGRGGQVQYVKMTDTVVADYDEGTAPSAQKRKPSKKATAKSADKEQSRASIKESGKHERSSKQVS